MFSAFLAFHIFLALFMGVVAVFSLIFVKKGDVGNTILSAQTLNVLFVLEVLSGGILGILVPTFSPLHFCANIGLYLTLFVVIQSLLYASLKNVAPQFFPLRLAYGAGGASILVLFAVLLVRTPLF